MLWRIVSGFTPMVFGWLIFSGAIPVGSMFSGGADYQKEVARPPEMVSHAISDIALDPMAGTSAAHLSGLPPIKRQKNQDGYSWFLMNGPDVVAELRATVEPAGDGQSSIVRTSVKPGTMQKLGPNFATKEALGMLFANAIGAELDVFAPPAERHANADQRRKSAASMQAAQIMANPFRAGLEAQKEYMKTQKELAEMEADMEASDAAASQAAYQRSSNVTFRPGQPMVNVSRQ